MQSQNTLYFNFEELAYLHVVVVFVLFEIVRKFLASSFRKEKAEKTRDYGDAAHDEGGQEPVHHRLQRSCVSDWQLPLFHFKCQMTYCTNCEMKGDATPPNRPIIEHVANADARSDIG